MRNLFINEFKFNLTTLKSIKNTNDHLAKVISHLEGDFDKVDNSNALKALYFSPTGEVIEKIRSESNIREEVTEFIIDVINNMSTDIDLYLFRVETLLPITLNNFGDGKKPSLLGFLRKNDFQFSPVIPIKDSSAVSKYSKNFLKESSLVPFIGYTYSMYTNARISYRFIMNRLDKIHEKNKGILTVGIPRLVTDKIDVSGTHYSNFVVSDVTGEKYNAVVIKRKNNSDIKFRLFDKDNLNLPELGDIKKDPKIYWSDVSSEIKDEKIGQLFSRIINRSPTAYDLKNSRPSYISRIYENIVSTMEFGKMRESIKKSDLKRYRKRKGKMNSLLESQQL
jgi:hypothetical protein